jgi:hypothetical protein
LKFLRIGRIPSLAVAALACWMYALVTGMSAPVVRAAGGFTLFLMASYLFRRIRIVNALAVVGFVYLVFDPEQLFDASFQLSFLSAAALAVFALPLMERWTEPLRIAAGSPDRVVANIKQDPKVAPCGWSCACLRKRLQCGLGAPCRWRPRLQPVSPELVCIWRTRFWYRRAYSSGWRCQ